MIHLQNVKALHRCNVIQVEGSHPSTKIRLHKCNVFTSFKCKATILHREVKNCLYKYYIKPQWVEQGTLREMHP